MTLKKLITLVLFGMLFVACSGPDARKPVVRKTSSFMSESIERNKRMNEAEEQFLSHYMESDTLRDYQATEYGFWYAYDQRVEGSTEPPVKGDMISFSYEIHALDGSIVYSKEELGIKHYVVDKEELISGLQEGVKLMKEGEQVTFVFPSFKAYGYTGDDRVGSNQPLIYKVELLTIKRQESNETN